MLYTWDIVLQKTRAANFRSSPLITPVQLHLIQGVFTNRELDYDIRSCYFVLSAILLFL